MLTLISFPGGFDQPSHSPFCTKAMCLLEMSGFDWTPEFITNPTRMPLSRLPVLKLNDRLIPDSHHIQDYLENRGADLFPGLTANDKAQAHFVIRTVEENLRMGLVHDRWLHDDCWSIVREAFFDEVPRLIRRPVTNGIRRKVRAALLSHGIAQFSEKDRLARLGRDLDALSRHLGGKRFLFGDLPCAADAAAVPVLDMLRTLPAKTPLRTMVRSRSDLMDYVTRGRAAIYPGAAGTAPMMMAAE